MDDVCDLAHRLQHTGLIIGEHQADHKTAIARDVIIREPLLQPFKIDDSRMQRRNDFNLGAGRRCVGGDCGMFNRADENTFDVVRRDGAMQRVMNRLRAAARKNDAVHRRVDQRAHLLACIFQNFVRAAPFFMHG